MKKNTVLQLILIIFFFIILWTPNLKFFVDAVVNRDKGIRDGLSALAEGSKSPTSFTRNFIDFYENSFGYRQDLINFYIY